MKNRIIAILLVLMGWSSLTVNAQKEVTVRLNPKMDVTYTAVIKNTMMNMMQVQGQSMTMTQTMETRSSFTAESLK